MAEGGGFEPPVRLYTVQRFSKPPPSATRPPLRKNASQKISNQHPLHYESQRLNHPKHSGQWVLHLVQDLVNSLLEDNKPPEYKWRPREQESWKKERIAQLGPERASQFPI